MAELIIINIIGSAIFEIILKYIDLLKKSINKK